MLNSTRALILATVLVSVVTVGCGSKGADGGIFKSTDAGTAWEQKVFVSQSGRKIATISELEIVSLTHSPFDSAQLMAGTESNGLYYSGNGGDQWGQVTQVNSGKVRSVVYDPTNSQVIYVAQNNTIVKTQDAGATWEVAYTETTGTPVLDIAPYPTTPSVIFAGLGNGQVIKSTDSGDHWSIVLNDAKKPIFKVLMNRQSPNIMYALEYEKEVWRSTDGGVTWTQLSREGVFADVGNLSRPKNILLDPVNPNTVYVISSGNGLIRSTNTGDSWENVSTLIGEDGDRITAMAIDPSNSNTLYLGIGKLIHKSVDGGQTWTVIETFPSGRNITAFLIDHVNPTTLYAGTKPVAKKKGLIGAN